MAEVNTFTGAGLDRAGALRRDAGRMAELRAAPESRALVTTDAGVYLRDAAPALVPLDALDGVMSAEPLLLGIDDEGRALFALDAEGAAIPALARAEPTPLREAAALLDQRDGGLVAYAGALLNWHRRHRHCSVCGAPTRIEEAGLLRVCPACGAHHHPRTDPVVIMLVTDSDRVLLGRQPSWPAGRYSALAGFVEPGESLEEAVIREVREECGVEAADPRYVSSQPWPFPSSLMLGFSARYAAGEPVVRDGELDAVGWFDRAEVAAAAEERGPLRLPPRLAIARRLLDGWLAGGG
jgi:NAD+ diphosphatase